MSTTASAQEDLCFTPAVELAARIRRREVSPVELVRALLDRIERLQPALNAYTVVYPEQALSAARRAESAGSSPMFWPPSERSTMPANGCPAVSCRT